MRGSIRKRGSSWQLAVYVGYERGRSRYRYETVTGTRREAERRLTQLMADVDSGRLGPSRAGTLVLLRAAGLGVEVVVETVLESKPADREHQRADSGVPG
jgi:hypothetical protein